jgi:hypothetical protein
MAIALSWSRLSDYLQCPLKFKLKYLTKEFPPEDFEKSVHLVKGAQYHKQLEDYVLAKNGQAPMPIGFSKEIQETLPYVNKLYNIFQAVHAEAQVACTADWKATEWFGGNVGWRAIWDVTGLSADTCFIGDYKSGKIYDYGSGYGQLHLSAVIGLNRFPQVEEIRTAYIYIEHKHVMPVTIKRSEVAPVQQYFEERFRQVQNEVAWEPTRNEFCKYCAATQKQCRYSRKL